MSTTAKTSLKYLLGELPLTAEAYWYLRQRGKPAGEMVLRILEQSLAAWRDQVAVSPYRHQPGKRILLFTTLRYWIEHAALLGMGLSGLGNQVYLSFSPYANWQKDVSRFDLRRQNIYIQSVLAAGAPYIKQVSFYNARQSKKSRKLPQPLQEQIEKIALFDAQYTRQIEEVDTSDSLYQLRYQRNHQAAISALEWLQANRPDVVITPNGSILEFAAVYQTCRYLDIPVITYEFGEQRQRIWFAHNAEVMRQETDRLWEAFQEREFTPDQLEHVRELFSSRQKASLWENFARRWQSVPSEGGERVRASLGLDGRSVVLLAANVIGDSLTLGRQVFTESMTEWLLRTARQFERLSSIQLVIRIHPGERYTKGPSVADIIQRALPELPEHIHLVAFDDPVNTYDLVQIADLGLVYTTTVGLEMAMSGVPVIVVGQTHYRGKGFTLDPADWVEYFEMLQSALHAPQDYRLTKEQVERAWHYAYRFFFDYPMPFPWHLLHMEKDIQEWPLARLFSPEGMEQFGQTFKHLGGEPRSWNQATA